MNNQPHPTCEAVRGIILFMAINTFVFSLLHYFRDDSEKAFARFALSMLLLSAWGIMEHIRKYFK
jgi:hypothetical protein